MTGTKGGAVSWEVEFGEATGLTVSLTVSGAVTLARVPRVSCRSMCSLGTDWGVTVVYHGLILSAMPIVVSAPSEVVDADHVGHALMSSIASETFGTTAGSASVGLVVCMWGRRGELSCEAAPGKLTSSSVGGSSTGSVIGLAGHVWAEFPPGVSPIGASMSPSSETGASIGC